MKRTSIIVISSHVVRGTVGNRAAAFALETLGHPVWAVPTVTLSWHPGHIPTAGAPTRLFASPEDFAALLKSLEAAPWLPEVGGILSGYLGDAAQADAIASLVQTAGKANPDLLYAADPVIGDGDRLYVPLEVAEAVRDRLVPLADIVTPNPFELAWLVKGLMNDAPAMTPHAVVAMAEALSAKWNVSSVLATSAPAMLTGHIANLLVEAKTQDRAGEAHMAEHRAFAQVPNGLGDLTAALYLSAAVQNKSSGKTDGGAAGLRQVTSAVASVLKRHMTVQGDELALEASTDELKRPSVPVNMRALSGPARKVHSIAPR
ncbi:MAG: pyridoxal kinase [Pseudomonadota bacterium]